MRRLLRLAWMQPRTNERIETYRDETLPVQRPQKVQVRLRQLSGRGCNVRSLSLYLAPFSPRLSTLRMHRRISACVLTISPPSHTHRFHCRRPIRPTETTAPSGPQDKDWPAISSTRLRLCPMAHPSQSDKTLSLSLRLIFHGGTTAQRRKMRVWLRHVWSSIRSAAASGFLYLACLSLGLGLGVLVIAFAAGDLSVRWLFRISVGSRAMGV